MKKIIFLVITIFISFTAMSEDKWPHQNISKAVFATTVENRVPIDIIAADDISLSKIYFFTNIRYLADSKITHRWIYKDKQMADVSFVIGGPRWRVWSSKNIWHTWNGEWKVQVILNDEEIIYEKEFNYKNKTN